MGLSLLGIFVCCVHVLAKLGLFFVNIFVVALFAYLLQIVNVFFLFGRWYGRG